MAPRRRRAGQCCEARFGFAIQFRRRPPVVRLLFQKREWSLQDRLLPPVLQAVDRAFQCFRNPGIRPGRPASTLIAFEQRPRSQHLPSRCPWPINHFRQDAPLVRRQLQHVLLTWHDDTLLSVMSNSSQQPRASPNQFIDVLLVHSIFDPQKNLRRSLLPQLSCPHSSCAITPRPNSRRALKSVYNFLPAQRFCRQTVSNCTQTVEEHKKC